MSKLNNNCIPETTLSHTLNKDDILNYLSELHGDWKIKNNELTRNFKLPTFNAAVGFLNSIVAIADIQDHHPRLTLDYNHVIFAVSTHETRVSKQAGFTLCDFIFAKKVEILLLNMGIDQ